MKPRETERRVSSSKRTFPKGSRAGAPTRDPFSLVALAMACGAFMACASPAGDERMDPSGGIAASSSALTLPLGDDPNAALVRVIADYSAALGQPIDPTAAVAASGISPTIATGLTDVLAKLLTCHRTTQAALLGLDVAAAADEAGGTGIGADRTELVRQCATDLRSSIDALDATMSTSAASGSGLAHLQIWPVVSYDERTSDTTYQHDYVLLVDFGGNDFYNNNAGGNLIDVRRGPVGSNALEKAAARGCGTIQSDVVAGECVPSAAVLIDRGGNDRYGTREAPLAADDPVRFSTCVDTTCAGVGIGDRDCSTDPIVRRMVTIGAGFAGVGYLQDDSGSDVYQGRTVTQGAGHLGGVGILIDKAGNDIYSAIRTAQGLGVVDGVGLLEDRSGNDTYTHYMPAGDATRPGGVVNDKGVCDAILRNLQGVGTVGQAEGTLRDLGGNDVYDAANGRAPGQASQGFGSTGGAGVFIDQGKGSDTYLGMPGRKNDVTLVGVEETGFTGVFKDELRANLRKRNVVGLNGREGSPRR
jgi:hypothetical protein